MELSVCLVLVNFEFIITEYAADGPQTAITQKSLSFPLSTEETDINRKRPIQYGQ